MITEFFLKSCFVVCVTTESGMPPTGYYNSSGELVEDIESAVRFRELHEVLKFIESHNIKLGETCYIELLI